MRRALHNLSHTVKLSGNQGEMIPIALVEALPGDVLDHSVTALIRTQPLVAPIMHEVDAKIHHWYIPTRSVWKNFPDFITGGPNGTDATVPPFVTSPPTTGFGIGSLADYLGVPTGVAGLKVSALPFRCYAEVYNNYYRDQDLQSELVINYGDGSDTTTSTSLQFGCWEKDYFTSARPSPQKGPSVSIPLTGNAVVRSATASDVSGSQVAATAAQNAKQAFFAGSTAAASGFFADLSNVNAVDIEDLRLAAALQRYRENTSMWGSRYVERIMQAFGVRPRSLEIDIPQYIGGGQQKISISEVLSTAETTDASVGEMFGHGITAMRSNRYRFPVAEHGYILSLLIIRPRTNYIQGLNKLWSRDTKEDFYQPELAYLGQQPILKKELYATGVPATDNATFGYQDAYESYREIPDRVSGEFRDTLDYWHMARKFATSPALNADFVKSNPTDRIYAVPAADQLYVMARNRISAKRVVIKNAKPQLF